MASLHVFISLWINSSMPNDGGATWTSYGKAYGSSNSWRTKLWSSIALCLSRSKYARKEHWRKEKQSEENKGQQLQSSCTLLEHFPKSIFYILYTISKLRKSRIQCFKPCTIWSWNEEVTAFGRWLLQAEGRIQQSVAKSTCEIFASHHAMCETGIFVPTLFL